MTWMRLFGSVHYYTYDFWDDYGSVEMKGRYSSPAPLIPIVGAYLWFVLIFGPRFMKTRKPYNVSFYMKWYNYINIVANGILCASSLWYTRMGYDVWFCQPFSSYVPEGLPEIGGFIYIALKVFDLMDTVFFVLRKKWNQITLLHIIHHSIMPFTGYMAMKVAFSPSPGIVLILNTFVHTIMYYYYHLASQGHQVWWKKYITMIQLVQFYITFIHAVHTCFVPGCTYPRLFAVLQIAESSYFTISFTRFYIKEYNKGKTKIAAEDTNQSTAKITDNNNNNNNGHVCDVSKKEK